MLKLVTAFASASLLLLGGCAGDMPTKQDEAPKAAAAKPALTEAATKALAQAEADVKAATAKKALWTTAQDALKKAKEAAEKGDSAAVEKSAKTASEHAKLGLGQAEYPMVK